MTATETDAATTSGRGPVFWGAMFVTAMIGAGALNVSNAIEGPAATILMIVPMILLLPFVKAAERRSAAKGCMNPVIMRYNRRMLLASFGYVLGLGIAITLWKQFEPPAPVSFALALLPTLPTFFMFWAMGRYLVEETDEYLRFQTIRAALMSLGMVLAVGLFYGFLEVFKLVPHIEAYWVLPVWAMGLGLAQLWMKVRGE
jgi:hypothetical protein